jgi:hypothetical protein
VLAPILGWAWRRFVRARRGTGKVTRLGAAALVFATLRQLVAGKPETVFRGSIEKGSGLQIRVLEPGER